MNWPLLICRLIGHRWQLLPRTDLRTAKLPLYQRLKQCGRCGATAVQLLPILKTDDPRSA